LQQTSGPADWYSRLKQKPRSPSHKTQQISAVRKSASS